MTPDSERRPGAAPGMTDAEWQARIDLAACYRLIALEGWDDLIYTHASFAVPGSPGHFLINPFGLTFDEIRASNLVKIDLDGNLVGDSPYRVNVTGFVIHSAVHAARADAKCVIHLHSPAGTAVSMLACGLLPLSQHALRFHRNLAYHDYTGLAVDTAERASLVADLGTHNAMLLRNHGTLTCGGTVAAAWTLMYTLEKACRMQLDAMSASDDLVVPPPEVLARTREQLLSDDAAEGEREWPALLRRLDRTDASYRT